MIKAIIFDLGNVLIHFDARRAARRFAQETRAPEEKVWRHFFTSKVEKAYTRGEITTREFFRHAQRAFHTQVSFRKFEKLWNDIFWENEGVRPILKSLSRRYPLYVISNTNALHFNYVRRRFPGIFRCFKRTFPSHRMGHRKPDPKIFWKVLKTTRLRPEEVVFIDDMPAFVESAQRLGIHTIQFRSNARLKKELRGFKVRI